MHGWVNRCKERTVVLLKASCTCDIPSLTTLINSDTPFLSTLKPAIDDDVQGI